MSNGVLRTTVIVELSAERLDRLQPLLVLRALPVLAQFTLVHLRPVRDELPSAWRQAAGDDLERLDVDRGFLAAIGRVEVRTTAVSDLVVVDPDHDPVEGADSRHLA